MENMKWDASGRYKYTLHSVKWPEVRYPDKYWLAGIREGSQCRLAKKASLAKKTLSRMACGHILKNIKICPRADFPGEENESMGGTLEQYSSLQQLLYRPLIKCDDVL
jgi:hypothetical protein